tara:strand:- start:1961 stop:3196 length:1236 start_codon:yes stop_codon:yes gene_type:complete
MINKNKEILIIVFLYFSLFGSLYFGEDSLGGAKHDFEFHKVFIYSFAENFKFSLINYGYDELYARNFPTFYILLSVLYKIGFSIDQIRFLNIFTIIPLIIIFYKTIDYSDLKIEKKFKYLFIISLLLSPTIRSLAVWPYPLLWAYLFFLISIYYFLKFQKNKILSEKIKYCFLNILFFSISCYLTPNLSFFVIFYLFYFIKYFKFSKITLLILFINFLLALPALIFLIKTEFYIFKIDYPFESINFNYSNKIVLISTLFLFYFLPFLSIKKFKNIFYNINYKYLILLILFCIINIYFFNFKNNAGGGIFYGLSTKLFNNFYLIYFVFIASILVIYFFNLINIKNSILFVVLIFYNSQYTIYHKYFDPLLMIIILLLFQLDKKYININRNIGFNYIYLYIFLLFANVVKNFI